MNELARAAAQQAGRPVELHEARGETLPFDDGRFDVAVSTWTLCSVGDAGQVLSEVHRVLKPGGRLLFIEHGLSHEAGVARWQRRLTPLQRRVADGCHLDRDFTALLEASPLEPVEVEHFYDAKTVKVAGYLFRGVAVKR
jgi:ubiquinone/menaquinone biosynthesis C-methylase UbiE